MTKHDLARTLLAQEPGRGYRLATAADTPFVTQINGQGNALSYQKEGWCCMTRLQLLYLRRFYGLTESQAMAVAALIWGAMQ